MRHTKAEATLTRGRVLRAALTAFADNGIRATTLADVAARAGVTRGAVYWHFSDKAALVAAVFESWQWPLDIGTDLSAYQANPQPLRLLRDRLWMQIASCMSDPMQQRAVRLALLHGLSPELPPDARDALRRAISTTTTRLIHVMKLAQFRGQLRAGLEPARAGHGLHAVGVGVLSKYTQGVARSEEAIGPLCLDIFLMGLSSSIEPTPT